MDNGLKRVVVISTGKSHSLTLNHAQNEFAMLLKETHHQVVTFISQDIDTIEKTTYIGKGKIEEIAYFCFNYNANHEDEKIDCVACNFELSGLQKKTIEEIVGLEVIDRTFVILDIFEKNARTKEAKLQVEIARFSYLQNHLIDERAAYSQVTSGSGHNKGKGEKQIELSRRQIANAIIQKQKELEEIKISRRNSRAKRQNNPIPKICIVGYTNAGKSTLLNRLVKISKEDKTVLEKNALFATLETSTRAVSIFGFPTFFLTDTVGFISQLPVYLVDAFRSTLEEITEADLLVQVIDISDPFMAEEVSTTEAIIKDLGADQIPMINIYNKFDLIAGTLPFLPKENEIIVSFLNESDVLETLKFMLASITKNWQRVQLVLAYDVDFTAFSKENYVISYLIKENGIYYDAYLNPAFAYKYINLN